MNVWIDRVCVVLSRYIFRSQTELLKLALNAQTKIYPMLTLRSNVKETIELSLHDQEYHVYDSFLTKYIASVYGTEFEKLWRFLRCGYRTFTIFSKCLCKDPDSEMVSGNIDEEQYKIEKLKISKTTPLIMPINLVYTKPATWSNECLSAQLLQASRDDDDNPYATQRAIVEVLRKNRFSAIHNGKVRSLSTFYMMPNVTIYNEPVSLSAQVMLEPISSDLYLTLILNSHGRLSNLSKEFMDAVVMDVYDSIYNEGNQIYTRLVRYLSAYCNVHVEHMFGLKKSSVISKVSDRLSSIFHHHAKSTGVNKIVIDGVGSGGICRHPKWPIYAIVYGTSVEDGLPAYSVTLQHSAILAKTCSFTRDHLSIQYNNYVTHSNNTCDSTVFGAIYSITWSGDSIAVFDKNGWLLIYHMRNLLYVENEHDTIAIPPISFRTHEKAYFMCWLGEYFIATIGDGLMNNSVNGDVIIVDAALFDGSGKHQEILYPPNAYSSSSTSSQPSSYIQQMTKSINEHGIPCLCIWDLVDYNKNNTPKLKVILADLSQIPHSLFNKRKHLNFVKFTCVLPIHIGDEENYCDNYTLLIFDSTGSIKLFSPSSNEIRLACNLHDSSIIKAFKLGIKRILTVDENGKVMMWALDGFNKPKKLHETVIRDPENGNTSSSSIVSSIGEYLGIKFTNQSHKVKSRSKEDDNHIKIIDVQLFNEQIVLATTATGNVVATQLPNHKTF